MDRRATGFALLSVFMAAMFLLGGGARDDVASLVLLRPLAVIFLGLGLALLPRETWRGNRALIALACALPLLALIHLLPLPPALWRGLPGRELIWQIGAVAGTDQPWRPISMVPYRTWNSFWSFFVPLAGLVLALGLPREHSRKLVYVLAAIILASGALGLLQSIGASGNGFYFYSITNDGSAVGLFANRNHQAMLLAIAFPAIAAAASLSKGTRETVTPKLWLAAGVGVMILPFLLATQSRAGLALGAVGIACAFFVYRHPLEHLQRHRQAAKFPYRWVGIGAAAVGLVVTTALVARTSALQRLLETGPSGDLRLRAWGPIADAAWAHFPVGSGMGTFVEVFQIIEPDSHLSPQYLNHAHNDWLEILLEGGLPAILILAGAIWFLGRGIYRAFAKARDAQPADTVLARLGAAIIIILALGSAYDYPLRVPSLACLFAIAVVWLSRRHAGVKQP